MCKRLTLVNYQKTQNIELFGSQVDSLASNLHDPRGRFTLTPIKWANSD